MAAVCVIFFDRKWKILGNADQQKFEWSRKDFYLLISPYPTNIVEFYFIFIY